MRPDVLHPLKTAEVFFYLKFLAYVVECFFEDGQRADFNLVVILTDEECFIDRKYFHIDAQVFIVRFVLFDKDARAFAPFITVESFALKMCVIFSRH